jgi:hypothetical protein
MESFAMLRFGSPKPAAFRSSLRVRRLMHPIAHRRVAERLMFITFPLEALDAIVKREKFSAVTRWLM